MPKLYKKNPFLRLNLLDYDLQICGILSRKRSGNGGYLKNKSIEYKIFNFMFVFFTSEHSVHDYVQQP
jgi:hypothetical protein